MNRFIGTALLFIRRLQRKKVNVIRRTPSALVLFLLILFWSVLLSWGLAQASGGNQHLVSQAGTSAIRGDKIGTVDVVPQRYQLGQKIYIESCGSCHIALPPAILPTQTWQQLLQDPQHYGQQITLLVDPPQSLVWDYLKTFSRQQNPTERVPYRIGESRYLKALHPRVAMPKPTTMATCATCHPRAAQYNFRSLTPEWEKAP